MNKSMSQDIEEPTLADIDGTNNNILNQKAINDRLKKIQLKTLKGIALWRGIAWGATRLLSLRREIRKNMLLKKVAGQAELQKQINMFSEVLKGWQLRYIGKIV